MQEADTSDTGNTDLGVRLPPGVAKELAVAAKAVGQSLGEFVAKLLTNHAEDPLGLWAGAVEFVWPTDIPRLYEAPVDIAEPDRRHLVDAATAGAKALCRGGDDAAAEAAVRESSRDLAGCWEEETYEAMVAYALETATMAWEYARQQYIGD